MGWSWREQTPDLTPRTYDPGLLRPPCRQQLYGIPGEQHLVTAKFCSRRRKELHFPTTQCSCRGSHRSQAFTAPTPLHHLPSHVTSVAEKKESSEVRLSSSSARRRSEPSVRGSMRVRSGKSRKRRAELRLPRSPSGAHVCRAQNPRFWEDDADKYKAPIY